MSRHRTHHSRYPRQEGFGLIEVLVSMLIVALALLGTVAMILYGMRVTQGGQLRNRAVILATEIAERMEANKTAALAGNYAVAAGTTVTSARNCATEACSPLELTNYDLAAWQTAVGALPGGNWQISVTTAGNPITYSVVVGWVERRSKTTYAATGSSESLFYTSSKTVGQ